MKDSILRSTFRAFCIALAAMLGLLVAIILVSLFFTAISSSTNTLTSEYSEQYLPNAKGARKVLSGTSPVILQVDVNGVIGTENFNLDSMRKMLTESREGTFKDDRVKAILLYINSPGGTVTDADGMYRALKEYKEKYKVPIIAYIDGLCASGGMYVASAADEIYASEVSLIGSVGVIMPSFFNVAKALEKLGIESLTLSAGKGKDELNPFRPWKANEQDNLQDIINIYYNNFVSIVSSNRPKINKNKLVADYGANVFPASQALSFGYIDGIYPTIDSALKLLLKKIGIEDDYYQVMKLESTSWFATLFKSQLLTGKVKHELVLPNAMDPKLEGQFLYLYRP